MSETMSETMSCLSAPIGDVCALTNFEAFLIALGLGVLSVIIFLVVYLIVNLIITVYGTKERIDKVQHRVGSINERVSMNETKISGLQRKSKSTGATGSNRGRPKTK